MLCRYFSGSTAPPLFIKKRIGLMKIFLKSPDIYFSHPKPKIDGFYSMNQEGKYFKSSEQLSYYSKEIFPDKIKFDLNIKNGEPIERTEENVNAFYRYLVEHPSKVHKFASSSLSTAGFISTSGVLRRMANGPYEIQSDKLFSAYLYQGVIYLGYINRDVKLDGIWKKTSYWGKKFEDYVRSEKSNKLLVTNIPVNEAKGFCAVFSSTLNNHRLYYSAEIDYIMIDGNDKQSDVPNVMESTKEGIIEELQKRKFVEFNMIHYKDIATNMKTRKSREIWLQCHFSGVDKIVKVDKIGYRNNKGIVRKLKNRNTDYIIQIGKDHWKPQKYVNFLDSFLSFVKEYIGMEIKSLPLNETFDLKNLPPIEVLFEFKTDGSLKVYRDLPFQKQWYKDGVTMSKKK